MLALRQSKRDPRANGVGLKRFASRRSTGFDRSRPIERAEHFATRQIESKRTTDTLVRCNCKKRERERATERLRVIERERGAIAKRENERERERNRMRVRERERNRMIERGELASTARRF